MGLNAMYAQIIVLFVLIMLLAWVVPVEWLFRLDLFVLGNVRGMNMFRLGGVLNVLMSVQLVRI